MELKHTMAATVEIDSDGRICLQQYDEGSGTVTEIYLTLEQFKCIENWVFKNRDEIELTWNGGVYDEANS